MEKLIKNNWASGKTDTILAKGREETPGER